MTDTIGFIGAGQLGGPMIARLLGAGHNVLVFARRDDVRQQLSAQGAELADSVADLARRSDVLISCLFSDDQLRELGSGDEGFIANARQGAIFVSHTTGTTATLRELAADPAAPVIVDAPVSGGVNEIASGTLTVLIGGPDAAVERASAVLSAYANPIIATGTLGTALDIKLINNLLFAANSQLVAAATSLGVQLGVEPGALLDALAVCSGGSSASFHMQQAGGLDSFQSAASPFLRKDIGACTSAAAERKADLGLLRTVLASGPLDLTAKTRENVAEKVPSRNT
ncbi:NAD(P)-dependent oxidoreductase [Rhodococcoides yunnanense]|uniref:NAD(P)-dependent oxidoreductase n=1 Tax=Rhodococcoides yunnanense TaxID=278209 RepID=A0ABU4BLF1_9NOCA|nr:NAD(P)-dependent oxidoreductase [Rhodococcus yunnanensis]MDV6264924.1 NAD(P)-dependent oxidoreductase [Rhodococcus yunnanensis]